MRGVRKVFPSNPGSAPGVTADVRQPFSTSGAARLHGFEGAAAIHDYQRSGSAAPSAVTVAHTSCRASS
jgi:hypothetical protein